MLEYFGYVTLTGNSWSGKIEKASFQVYTEGFEEYLKQRPIVEGLKGNDLEQAKKRFPVLHPVVVRKFSASGWKANGKGFLTLEFKDYTPKENLTFLYYLVSFPKNLNDAQSLAKQFKEKQFKQEDLQDLIDILKEYNGEKSKNERIQNFIKNQVWYSEETIDKIPLEIITYLQTLKKEFPK